MSISVKNLQVGDRFYAHQCYWEMTRRGDSKIWCVRLKRANPPSHEFLAKEGNYEFWLDINEVVQLIVEEDEVPL